MKSISDEIESKVVGLLKSRKLIMTTAESCTAGLVAARIVNVPGASSVLHEGYITYCDEAKIKILGVKEETLAVYKAVSEQTAIEMAEGGAKIAGADVCVSVTGVAGPDTEDGKPVGLVYIGCFYKGNVVAKEYNFLGDRACIREAAVNKALELVYSTVTEMSLMQ